MIFDIIKQAKQLVFDNSKSGLKATNTQDAIDEVDNSLSNYVVTDYVSATYTCNAGSATRVSTTIPEKQGYKPIAVILHSTGSSYVFPYVVILSLSGTEAQADIRNTHTSSVTESFTFRIIYIRDI